VALKRRIEGCGSNVESGQPAPFDTTSALLQSTQDASSDIRPKSEIHSINLADLKAGVQIDGDVLHS